MLDFMHQLRLGFLDPHSFTLMLSLFCTRITWELASSVALYLFIWDSKIHAYQVAHILEPTWSVSCGLRRLSSNPYPQNFLRLAKVMFSDRPLEDFKSRLSLGTANSRWFSDFYFCESWMAKPHVRAWSCSTQRRQHSTSDVPVYNGRAEQHFKHNFFPLFPFCHFLESPEEEKMCTSITLLSPTWPTFPSPALAVLVPQLQIIYHLIMPKCFILATPALLALGAGNTVRCGNCCQEAHTVGVSSACLVF